MGDRGTRCGRIGGHDAASCPPIPLLAGSLSRGLNFPVRNQQMICNQFVVQTRLDQMIVVLLIGTANGSEERAVLKKEKTAWISERA